MILRRTGAYSTSPLQIGPKVRHSHMYPAYSRLDCEL